MKVFLVAGARPNFMKIAPIYRASQKYEEVSCKIVHTGQHYDFEMSQAFFQDLDLPEPDFYLGAGSGSHATQTAKIMVAFEEICIQEKPDWVIVVGDVNSTLACSITAKKLLIQVAHVEAGLRSFDLTMPEEINRIVTDAISDLLFVTEESGIRNLINEGKNPDQIYFVGNVMIDNLFYQLEKLKNEKINFFSSYELKNKYKHYGFLTLHRPSNVDDELTFKRIIKALNDISCELPLIFPVHPRTKSKMDKFNIKLNQHIEILPPLGFLESLFLWKDATIVITDSGGLQEETTALGIPCITLRNNTERPITVEIGTNILAGTEPDTIYRSFRLALEKKNKRKIPPKWDGKAAERICKILFKSSEYE